MKRSVPSMRPRKLRFARSSKQPEEIGIRTVTAVRRSSAMRRLGVTVSSARCSLSLSSRLVTMPRTSRAAASGDSRSHLQISTKANRQRRSSSSCLGPQPTSATTQTTSRTYRRS